MQQRSLPAGRSAARSLILAIAALAAFTSCKPAAPVDARAAIQAEIAKGVHALKTRNVDEYMAQIADDVFERDTVRGPNPRQRIRAEVLKAWADIDSTRVLEIRVDSVFAEGDSATVVTTMKWDRLIKSRGPPDTLITNVQHREIWKRTPKGWRSVKLLAVTGGSTRNGVPEQ